MKSLAVVLAAVAVWLLLLGTEPVGEETRWCYGTQWDCYLAEDRQAGEPVYVGPRSGIKDAHARWLADRR